MSVEKSIQQLIIPQEFEHNAPPPNITNFNIIVRASIPDPDRPTRRKKSKKLINAQPDLKVGDLIKKFLDMEPDFEGHDFFMRYNHRLYKNGTLGFAGITSSREVELISLESEQTASRNEGFIFSFWSLVPLMISISFLVPGLAGTFDTVYRGLFVLCGTIVGLPATILFIIGVSELYSSKVTVSFVNNDWFGPCQCACCMKSVDDDRLLLDAEDESDIDTEMFATNNEII
ncbi:hypothetical protein TRFO_33310 [Tritrichomonas foetus]|uniref:Uncharacterized protein n=1 Tax=Tritrichomonas foetus TaxID=1144522 RepID=A0A1J4JN05_9EUKA|nr:hypothetical protein TRFO_33310 [Tritrichomonas foetus]|eukprot:OHT00074.1 hypothetical protein TRFO_33310 [Tritrichomonas foetus]